MTDNEIEDIRRFNARMGMYIPAIDRDNIVSFIHGFELGTRSEFTEMIEDYIEKTAKVKRSNLGWPGQVAALTFPPDTWVDSYLRVSEGVLSKATLENAMAQKRDENAR